MPNTDLKEDLKLLSAQSSTLTSTLKNKLEERFMTVKAINELKEVIQKGKVSWQLKLSEMDKETLKEFGSNAETRQAKIDANFSVEESALKTLEISLREIDFAIENAKIDLRHLNFEREVIQTVLMA